VPLLFLGLLLCSVALAAQSELWLDFEPSPPVAGKKIVLVSGDDEYRSEEALPMLARILSRHHGFDTTVLFAIDPATGVIAPEYQTNIPGLEALADADAMVLFTRFRELPDDQMKHIVDFLAAGKPVVALRTATHAFFYRENMNSPYAHWSWNDKTWPGGFGQQVLGETWVSHHGKHGSESTRSLVEKQNADHPILTGVGEIWCTTDVYSVSHLPDDATLLLRGQVLADMSQSAAPVTDGRNDPAMPIAWTRQHRWPGGEVSRVFTTTMGAATDLVDEDLRRLVVNAVYWAVGLESAIRADSSVELVGGYQPTAFGFGNYVAGRRPADYK
jgi:type 1 glutamine amidotransferase